MQVMNSEGLRTMLQVCVQAGNVLNQGSFRFVNIRFCCVCGVWERFLMIARLLDRGDAVAVDIGFLSQMKGMRANGSSLLDFICAQMQENSPGTLESVV